MASTLNYVQFVCDQIKGNWNVRYKKMFGEYMVYVNEKPILLVCDNNVYVKIIEELKDVMQNAKITIPYDGAKQRYVLDIEDNDLVEIVIDILEKNTTFPLNKIK